MHRNTHFIVISCQMTCHHNTPGNHVHSQEIFKTIFQITNHQGVNTAEIMLPCTFSLKNCDLRFVDFIGLRLHKSIFYPVASVTVYLRKQTFVNIILPARSLIIQSSGILICLTVIFQ